MQSLERDLQVGNIILAWLNEKIRIWDLGFSTGDGAGTLEGDNALVLRQVGADERLHALQRGHALADLLALLLLLLLRFALTHGARHHDRQVGVCGNAQLLEKLRQLGTANKLQILNYYSLIDNHFTPRKSQTFLGIHESQHRED